MTIAKDTVTEWQGLIPDDVVKIDGEKGTFTFLSAVLNKDTQETLWVSVYGGSKGREKMRAFMPGRVIIPNAKVLQKQRNTQKKGQ